METFTWTQPSQLITEQFHSLFQQSQVYSAIVCGLDGSGKQSAVKALSELLAINGYNVVTISYPYDYSKSGQLLRKLLSTQFDWLDFSFEERIALYALNRAETISLLHQSVVMLNERNQLPVYILFDRGPTSSLVTYAAVEIVGKTNIEIEKALRQESIVTALHKMYQTDGYFISQLHLENTPVFVPMLSSQSTMSALIDAIQNGERLNKESYETTEVQEAAREVYMAAARYESKLRLFSQYREDNSRLSKTEVAEYLFEQINPGVTTRSGEILEVKASFMLYPELIDSNGIAAVSEIQAIGKGLTFLHRME